MSETVKAKYLELNLDINRFIRYPILLIATLFAFIKEKPDIIFTQNPSLVLSIFAVIWGKLFNLPVVVDSHNAGLFPFEGTRKWANELADFVIRHATLTLVTNAALTDYVETKGGKAFAVPDPIPVIEAGSKKMKLKGVYNILFICTWAYDEPYMEVIKAAELIDKKIYIYFTGNSRSKEKKYDRGLPGNVILTGFLDELDYISILKSCDIIMDLTTLNDCLVCGAYEAVAAEKPLITSDTEALRNYFYKGALYTDSTCENISKTILEAISNMDNLRCQIKDLKADKIKEWDDKKNEINSILEKFVYMKDLQKNSKLIITDKNKN